MELRQLEYLVAVVQEANFTRAAERIHVAQPAVSAQIQRLERELGQPLLDRSRRAVRLTSAGEAVLPYAKAALAAVNDINVAVDDITQLVRGTVTIGAVACGPTLQTAVFRAVYTEVNARIQHWTIALGGGKPAALDEEEGRLADAVNQTAGMRAWDLWRSQVRAATNW